jgi:hypothetical protein
MVSISFLRGSGKRKQGGRPGLSIEIDSQLRNSAGLEPASPLLSSSSGIEDTLHANYSIVSVVYIISGAVVKSVTGKIIDRKERVHYDVVSNCLETGNRLVLYRS